MVRVWVRLGERSWVRLVESKGRWGAVRHVVIREEAYSEKASMEVYMVTRMDDFFSCELCRCMI